jgi:8-oxo-dGTP pyrophosphatase MutT (NUDIX family)
MTRKYNVYHLEELLTFSQEGFDEFIKKRKLIHAAGGLVQNTDGDFLFMERNDTMDLPKGKLEKGESDEEGALREVEEETGVSGLEIIRPLLETYHTYTMKGEDVIKRTAWYLMHVEGCPTPTPQVEEGISWVKWMSKEEVNTIIPKAYISVAEVWRKANV